MQQKERLLKTYNCITIEDVIKTLEIKIYGGFQKESPLKSSKESIAPPGFEPRSQDPKSRMIDLRLYLGFQDASFVWPLHYGAIAL